MFEVQWGGWVKCVETLGGAASAYINTFGKLEEDMNQIDHKIQEHVSDLNEMAANYISVEDTATQGNSALNSDYI